MFGKARDFGLRLLETPPGSVVTAGCASPGHAVRSAQQRRLAPERSAEMLDRLSPSAEELATAWIGAFDVALGSRSEIGLSELFVADSHWRNLLGISWHFATFSGNRMIARELLQRAASAGATGFRINTAALAPRQAMVAGREVIEAVISFDTANGPGIGALRLLPAPSGRVAA
jgi:putative flavoprotein involved in K+ transport